MISRDAIETAYSFFHQKQRIYAHSTIASQKDDIEYAISSYVEGMSLELYLKISEGEDGFLLRHDSFGCDIANAVERLEKML